MIVYEKQSTGFIIMYGFSMIICMKDTHYKTRRRFITGVERPVQLRLQGVLIPTTAARPARQRAPIRIESMADEIVFYNLGHWSSTPKRKRTSNGSKKRPESAWEVNEVPWSNLKPASPRSDLAERGQQGRRVQRSDWWWLADSRQLRMARTARTRR